jgi:alkylhydroperoxidase family enzyme
VLADFRAAPISPQLKAMLSYLEKSTISPEALGVEDARSLVTAGISKAAAEDALFVSYCFNQIVRIADALGWEVLGQDGFAASAKSLLKFGYLLPFHRKG